MCVRAKFWDRLILPQILFVFFLSRLPRKLILSIFSKSKRPFEKQTTPRLVTYLGLSMDKIWAKMIFDCGREISILLDFYRHLLLRTLQTYRVLNISTYARTLKHELIVKSKKRTDYTSFVLS